MALSLKIPKICRPKVVKNCRFLPPVVHMVRTGDDLVADVLAGQTSFVTTQWFGPRQSIWKQAVLQGHGDDDDDSSPENLRENHQKPYIPETRDPAEHSLRWSTT